MRRKLIIAALIISIVLLISACGEEDHNDGKCDICGKASTYSDGDEEYCDKHLEDAVKWYIEQGNH